MKYRKLPVVIDAVQYDGTQKGLNMINGMFGKIVATQSLNPNNIVISTWEGNMTATKGDYIIKGVHGEPYPCKPEIFNETYEEVTDE